MNKRYLIRPLSVGLAAAFFALPVYAEENAAGNVPAAATATTAEQDTAAKNVVKENPLTPYIGKTITKQVITGNTVNSEAEIAAALKTKPGMELTEQGLNEDLSAIYDLGWFYDLRPEFKEVPEGVQVIYHVMENPAFTKVKITGNTVVDDKKAAGFFDLEENKIINLKDVNTRVQRLEEEYRQNGYIWPE